MSDQSTEARLRQAIIGLLGEHSTERVHGPIYGCRCDNCVRAIEWAQAALAATPDKPSAKEQQQARLTGITRQDAEEAAVWARSISDKPSARPCTCHPDDKPPVPCAEQYALSECRQSVSDEEIARKARIEIYSIENEDKQAEKKIERIILGAIQAARNAPSEKIEVIECPNCHKSDDVDGDIQAGNKYCHRCNHQFAAYAVAPSEDTKRLDWLNNCTDKPDGFWTEFNSCRDIRELIDTTVEIMAVAQSDTRNER